MPFNFEGGFCRTPVESGEMEHADPRTTYWQRALLALCALALACALLSIFENLTWGATVGYAATPTSTPFHDRVVAVRHKDAAEQAGMKVGDTIDFSAASPADRFRVRLNDPDDRHEYKITLYRGSSIRHITLRPGRETVLSWDQWLYFAGAFGAILFSTLIAWRRPTSIEGRVLCVLLTSDVIFSNLQVGNWTTPLPSLDFSLGIVSAVMYAAWSGLLVGYTLLFARPISRIRRVVAIAAFSLFSLVALEDIVAFAGNWTGRLDLIGGSFGASALHKIVEAPAFYGLPLLAIALAVAAAKGRERSLLVWTTAMLFVENAAGLVSLVVHNVPAFAANIDLRAVPFYIGNAAQFLTPFFIGYALLNRRILDIGFALNRAIVFSVVSLFTVAVFVLVEWALSEWLNSASHSTNVLVAAGLALALGLSMRFVHRHIDDAVDRALFFKRRRDQDAIAAFAREAAYITEIDVLLERTRETLLGHADATSVSILLDDRSGRYGNLSENDPAIVALRANHEVLDLHGVTSEMRGDYAFPMVSRGRVLGILVLGPKHSGEAYAPDERAIILQLAHSVASAFDLLQHENGADPAIAKIDAMYAALVSLPAAIRDANRELLEEVTRSRTA